MTILYDIAFVWGGWFVIVSDAPLMKIRDGSLRLPPARFRPF